MSNWPILLLLGIALLLHGAFASLFPSAGWTTSAGVSACNLVALVLCLQQHRVAATDAQWRWIMLACTFFVWTMAFVALAGLQSILDANMEEAQADSLFFMLRGVPLLLIVSRTGEGDRSAAFRWIDVGQATLFIALAALLLFPRLLSNDPNVPLVTEKQTLLYHDFQNYVLAAFALISLAGQTRPASWRFTYLLCWLLCSYALVASVVNHWIILQLSPQPGSLILMSADIPQALFIIVACSEHTPRPVAATRFHRSRLFVRLIQPALFSAGLIILAFAVSRVNFAIGVGGGILSLSLKVARSALTQNLFLTAQHELAEARDRLELLAGVDPLTLLPNRRLLDERLTVEWNRAARGNSSLAVLVIDVDEFKSYNDTAGHLAGDECLRAIAGAMRQAIKREGDMLARYGGEEFVVVAPTMTIEAAVVLGEMLRRSVNERALPHPSNAAGIVTVSIGVAVAASVDQREGSPEKLFRSADAALYQAKALGRNRVRAWDA